MEFSIRNSLPIYDSGLGVLAGDFWREASDQSFSMTVLALKMANHRDAVSQRHEKVTRKMWQASDYLDSAAVCYNRPQGL